MRFLYPEFLWLLLLPFTLFTALIIWRTKSQKKALKEFGEKELVSQLMPELSLRSKFIKDFLMLFTLSFMILALARPQIGAKSEKVKSQGIEMMVCLDISNSMLSRDVSPSRLELAKMIVKRIADKLENNRIGLIYFAGDAYVQLPITADFISLRMLLNTASPSLIQAQGTEIGEAIQLGIRSFSKESKVKKAIVIITDAEDNGDDAMNAIEKAKEAGIIVTVIGVGTPEGGPIPMNDGSYLTDKEGNMVITKLNATSGQELASAGGGTYIQAQDISRTVKVLEKSIDKLEKSDLETTVYTAYDELFAFFLIPALLLLLFDFLYLDRKNQFFNKLHLFDEPEK